MESRLVEVNFLHPQLPAKSYIYPRRQDILDVDPTDILTLVSPTTATGRSFIHIDIKGSLRGKKST